MFALRGCVARSSALLSTEPAVSQARAFASKTRKPKVSWRKKAKMEERARNAGKDEPRQPPRVKVVRQNHLVEAADDGKKWRILSASILERLPVIQPDLAPWEEEFEMVQHEISLREDQVRCSACPTRLSR